MDSRSDSELVLAFQRGEMDDTFNEIDRRYRQRLERFMIRQGLDRLIPAEELVQETLKQAWLHLSHLKEGASLLPWLFRIAIRTAIDFSRTGSRKIVTTSFSDDFNFINEDSLSDRREKTPLELLIQKEERLNVWHTVQTILSEEDFHIIWLFYIEEYTTAEIAKICCQKVGTIRVRLHRARKKLAETYKTE